MKYVLLDTNILIGAFDGNLDNDKHQETKALVTQLLQDDDVKIAITPLIRYEVLRGVKNIAFNEMRDILDDFVEFAITDKIGNGASELYKVSSKQSNKHNFDIFHYTVSKVHHLELKTLDKDFSTYDDCIQSIDFFKNL